MTTITAFGFCVRARLRIELYLVARETGQRNADVAQLVEHHLAKVRVAGSSPVIRSEASWHCLGGGVAERRGSGLQSRIHGFESRRHLGFSDSSSVGELARLAQR